MKDAQQAQGKCLCGSVNIDAKTMDTQVSICHCSNCRKWSGPLIASECGTQVDITPSSNVTRYQSSPWAERGFCKLCGTHLFYKIIESGEYIIPAGIFDSLDDQFELVAQIFIDEKPAFYNLENDCKRLTGQDIFDMYAPKPEQLFENKKR